MVVTDYIDPNSGSGAYGTNTWRAGDLYLQWGTVRDLKRVPVRLIKAYFKGLNRARFSRIKRVDALVLGRVSAASAHVLMQGYEETLQLNWELYREFRDASTERRVEMLPAHLAWSELGINPYEIGLDRSAFSIGEHHNLWYVHPTHFDLSTGEANYTRESKLEELGTALAVSKQWFQEAPYFSGAENEIEFFSQFSSEAEMKSLEQEGWLFTRFEEVEQYRPEGVRVAVVGGFAYKIERSDLAHMLVLFPMECKRRGLFIVSEVTARKRVKGSRRGSGHYEEVVVPFIIDTVRGIEVSGDDIWGKLKEAAVKHDRRKARLEIEQAILDGEESVSVILADAKAAGFCFRGTMKFLRDKAPYLHTLFSYASSWEELKEEDLSYAADLQLDWSNYSSYLKRVL